MKSSPFFAQNLVQKLGGVLEIKSCNYKRNMYN